MSLATVEHVPGLTVPLGGDHHNTLEPFSMEGRKERRGGRREGKKEERKSVRRNGGESRKKGQREE